MNCNESIFTADYLRKQLSYNPETGEFFWILRSRGRQLNKPAGSTNKSNGYRQICISHNGNNCLILAHRIAWIYVYGVWPDKQIDHIDRDRLNNRISNLRESTQQENMRNRTKKINTTSRYIGVWWSKNNKKWQASIGINRKYKYLGYFSSEQEAALAYNAAAIARDPNFNSLNIVPQ